MTVLLIAGSLRNGSTNSAVLRTAAAVAPDTAIYTHLGDLPHFNPDDDREPLHPVVADLRGAIRTADAVLFCTPEYAGALPGSFLNLLDWAVGDDQPGSMYEKPVAWINASAHGGAFAHDSLRTVLGYLKATIVEAGCAEIPVTSAMVGDDGLISDPTVRDEIAHSMAVLVEAAGTAAGT